jgi:FPC/CPF motif-containing protein YcgG
MPCRTARDVAVEFGRTSVGVGQQVRKQSPTGSPHSAYDRLGSKISASDYAGNYVANMEQSNPNPVIHRPHAQRAEGTNSCPHAMGKTSSPDLVQTFIADKGFPCVGAKSALNKGRMRFGDFGRLGERATAHALVDALEAYSAEFPQPGTAPVSFVASFEDTEATEMEFEALLWKQLQAMHEVDRSRGNSWDARVSADPSREDFSFSVAGRAFFVVGLHPNASRLARRTPVPCLVFNFHEQFETLKASGKYQLMQQAIRARDIALQGSVNPVLARFGESSEARQYSGRAVEQNWKCPFHQKN